MTYHRDTRRTRIRSLRSAVALGAIVAMVAVTGCNAEVQGSAQVAAGADIPSATSTSSTDRSTSITSDVPDPTTDDTPTADITGGLPPGDQSTEPATSATLPTNTSAQTPTAPPTPTRTADPTTLTLSTTSSVPESVACLYDTWTMSNPVFAADINAMAGGAASDVISGSATVTFNPDGTFATHYNAWTHEIKASGQAGTITMIRDGVDTGTFTATADGDLTMTDISLDSTISMTMRSAQGTFTMRPPPVAPGQTTVFFDCTADSDIMEIVADGNSAIFGRGAVVE